MQSFFAPKSQQVSDVLPGQEFNALTPKPWRVAAILSSPNPPRANRRLARAGAAYIWAPAAYPARHGISRCCGKRTYISTAGTCRKCFLNGDGPIDEVSFS